MQYQGMQEDLNRKWSGQTLYNQTAMDEFQNDFWQFSIAEAKSYCRSEQQCQDLVRRMMANFNREFASKPLPRDISTEIIVRLGLLYGKTGGNISASGMDVPGYYSAAPKDPGYTRAGRTPDPYAVPDRGGYAQEPARQASQSRWDNQYTGASAYGSGRPSDPIRNDPYQGGYRQDTLQQDRAWDSRPVSPTYDTGRSRTDEPAASGRFTPGGQNYDPAPYQSGYQDNSRMSNPGTYNDRGMPINTPVQPVQSIPNGQTVMAQEKPVGNPPPVQPNAAPAPVYSAAPAAPGTPATPVTPAAPTASATQAVPAAPTAPATPVAPAVPADSAAPAVPAGAVPVTPQYVPYMTTMPMGQAIPGAVQMAQPVMASTMPVGMPLGQMPVQTISMQPVMQVPVQPVLQTPVQATVVQPQTVRQAKPAAMPELINTDGVEELLGMTGNAESPEAQEVIAKAAQLIQAYNAANRVNDALADIDEEEVEDKTEEADPSKAAGWHPPKFGKRKPKPKEKPAQVAQPKTAQAKPLQTKQNPVKSEPAKPQSSPMSRKAETEREEGSSVFSIINTALIILTVASVSFLIWETGLIQRFL